VNSVYELHQLLWDIRRHPAVRDRYLAGADEVLDAYGIHGDLRGLMKALDFKSMYEHGTNPYLLYFCAIQLQVDRAAYYAQIRGETP
jgi:Aromatic-ring-opening dioxygenase LigAB, LigA subunit